MALSLCHSEEPKVAVKEMEERGGGGEQGLEERRAGTGELLHYVSPFLLLMSLSSINDALVRRCFDIINHSFR